MSGFNLYQQAVAAPHPSGAIIIDGKQVADTLQCVHCGGHFVLLRGSGRKRGYCTHCNGPICNRRECFKCVPFEKQLEKMEGKKHPDAQIFIARK